MIEYVLDEVNQYIHDQLPNEACGVLAVVKGRPRFFPCENKSDTPLTDFVIDPYDYKKIADEADIVAVIHSHPYEKPEASIADRAACDRLGKPWYIFGLDDEYIKIEPAEHEQFDLVGRPFVYGVYDCFTICRDYYKPLGIDIFDHTYEWEFWKKGKNLYLDNFEKEGFVQVTDNSLQPHDGILMALNSQITNHAGIYVGKFKMLHHAPNRLSCRDPYTGMWKKITRLIVRHEKFL